VKDFSLKEYTESFAKKEYIKGEKTEYYIITAKLDLHQYKFSIVKNDVVLFESLQTGLNKTKYSAIEKLYSIDPLALDTRKLSMVHYKHDRPSGKPWVKDSNIELQRHIYSYLTDVNSVNSYSLSRIVDEDIESELAEEDTYYKDGAVKEYYGKRYERKPENRLKAIEIHGLNCAVCGFNFEEFYGEWGRDFIEVHHLKPLSTIKTEVNIDPSEDLAPVCSNCHKMLHRKRDKVLSIQELKELINRT
jgi:5-methylcytosine-specific restriction protein A